VVKRRTPAGFRPQETRYEWDAHDRLVRIHLPDGARWRYRYDCFGRRVSKAGKAACHP
jgi:YD repeat-containing protein